MAQRVKERILDPPGARRFDTPLRPDSDTVISLAADQLEDMKDGGLKDPWEVISLFGHAFLTSYHFDLVGLSDDSVIKDPKVLRVLPEGWNNEKIYTFKYTHPEGAASMSYLFKVRRSEGNAVLHFLAIDNYEGCDTKAVEAAEVSVQEFVDVAKLPLAHQEINKDTLKKVFKGDDKIHELTNIYAKSAYKMAPNALRPITADSASDDDAGTGGPSWCGTSKTAAEHQQQQQRQGPPRPFPLDEAIAAPGPERTGPTPDFPPPKFEDEYGINQPPGPDFFGGRNPQRPNLGERDLYPQGMGPHDPFVPHMGPRLGPGGSGGMHPTPDDPLFTGQGGRGYGYDPQAPPGARWDPLNPDHVRPGGGRGGPRGNGGFHGLGGPGRGFGGGPGGGFDGGFGGGFGGGII